jgi:hypothetical protein
MNGDSRSHSGGLYGGAFVRVGGDEQNSFSWIYNMIFDGAGKLAYYRHDEVIAAHYNH